MPWSEATTPAIQQDLLASTTFSLQSRLRFHHSGSAHSIVWLRQLDNDTCPGAPREDDPAKHALESYWYEALSH